MINDYAVLQPHLAVPYCLRRIKLPEENLGEFLRLVVFQVADHGFWQHVAENAANHYVRRLVLQMQQTFH